MNNNSTIFKKRGYTAPIKPSSRKREIPEGLWTKCPSCSEVVFNQQLDENLRVCPKCDYHFPVTPRMRTATLLDEGSFEEFDVNLMTVNALDFPQYSERIKTEQENKGLTEAVITGVGKIDGIEVSLAIMDFSFLGGSMGVVVGEKISRAIERAIERKIPVIIMSASGGARMHEGTFSLMQMAKVSGVLLKLGQERLPYISVLLNPTTGGVTASYATLGDVILAEPGAMIGFAGPRVIKETTHQDLPKNFQTAEFLMERGLLDQIVSRKQMRSTLVSLLRYMFSK